MSEAGQNKIYEMVTETILTALKNGTVPWQQQWRSTYPYSLSTGKPYRGINVWLLGIQAGIKGYKSPFWGTYDRIAELAGMVKVNGKWRSPDGTPRGVRAGEKSTVVVFWKRILVDDKNAPDGKKAIFMLRYYRVFNADQADGLPAKYGKPETTVNPDEAMSEAEQAFLAYISERGPELVKSNGDLAGYSEALDTIILPEDDQFKSRNGRLETSFHEATHSTGHGSRLNRPGVVNFDHFGSGQYAEEELVAAMGAAMLLGTFGIDTETENSAAYIAHWLKVLANDHKLVIKAAAKAQKAADYILGITHTEVSE